MKNKLLILCATLFVTQGLNAQNTTCYKKLWYQPSTIETTALDGGECNSKYSVKDMKKKGWIVKDIDIQPANNGMSYEYQLSYAGKNTEIENTEDMITNLGNIQKVDKTKSISFLSKEISLSNVNNETATINIGNLEVGQSGVIKHSYGKNQSIIISNASVSSSNASTSIIKFTPFLDLKQDSIPTTNIEITNDDTFILNYLYDASLIIAPNANTFRSVRSKFKKNNFLHSDIFAAFLKTEYRPKPSKDIIQDFAISQNIGTIFFVIESKIFIVDSKTFKIIDEYKIENLSEKNQMPFYTRIEEIESNVLTSDIFDISFSNIFETKTAQEVLDEYLESEKELKKNSKKESEYTSYYKKLLGV